MKLLIYDLKRLPILLVGFVFLSFGIHLTRISTLGMAPWGVFHEGLVYQTGLSFGWITIIVGAIVLLLSVVFLKSKIGIGTILNVLLVGAMIDFFETIIKIDNPGITEAVFVLVIGTLSMTFGRSLYIASRLGAGPRDGIFVGLARVSNLEVKYIKPIIDVTVFVFGLILGATPGYGTLFIALISGYLVQFYFKLLHFNPKTVRQNNIIDYTKKGISFTK